MRFTAGGGVTFSGEPVTGSDRNLEKSIVVQLAKKLSPMFTVPKKINFSFFNSTHQEFCHLLIN
jgi:hypothetical protein